MNKNELNKYAITVFEKAFQENGFMIGESSLPNGQVNLLATSKNNRTIKIKVRSITQVGSYIFIEKTKFNIEDPDLYMAVLYQPNNENDKILYLVPATEWGKDIYPFSGYDYNKEGQVSLPEWGIRYSQKAKDAMESYRFSNIIKKFGAEKIHEVIKIKEYCEQVLDLENAKLSDEFFYQSLPLCIIDAIYSIGVSYTSTRNTVIKYCDYFHLKRIRDIKEEIPDKSEQQSITNFVNELNRLGVKMFTEDIFKNKQRTSATSGILKAEAVLQFANVLKESNVEYFQDIDKVILNEEFKSKIQNITGQKSGISLQYFFMLSGSNEFIKSDRMIMRFLDRILERKVAIHEAQAILTKVSNVLKQKYEDMTPRKLDYQIWEYESNKAATNK